MAETTYKVTLPLGFLAPQRVRSGIVVTTQDGYEGPLTAEQLKAVKADGYLTVVEIKADKPAEPAKKSK